MIVCFCVATTDTDIDLAIAEGARTVEEVGQCCGAGTGCGSCHEYIESALDSAACLTAAAAAPAEPAPGLTQIRRGRTSRQAA
ncbi:MAG: hypothetical protein Tsb0020_43280 [Haliangiales bacterium]